MSLRASFFLLALCGLLLALGLLFLLWQACRALAAQYPAGGFAIDANGVITPLPTPTPEQFARLQLLGALPLVGAVVFPLLALSGAGALFYRWKLQRPIALLLEGTRRIQAHDLDFSLPAAAGDELGQVCAAFETMRAELLKSNRELWRQAEERRRLNAAFAHDLRNPITVLKGSLKLLRRGVPDEETLTRLENHTLRIEQYVEAMSSVQRLEQLPVRPRELPWGALCADLEETARLLAPGLPIALHMPEGGAVELDRGIFLTVAENLIGNASRFAKSRLEVSLTRQKALLRLTVADDGPGFGAGLLAEGPKPFGRAQENPEHFGMGLYSSRLLCEKHGGALLLKNAPAGGAVVTASFQMPFPT